jgi:hypothetical protein
MGLFAELDLEDAADDPFATPLGTFGCVVKECKLSTSDSKFVKVNGEDDTTKPLRGLSLIYQINDGGDNDGDTISEYKSIPYGSESVEDKRALSFLKQRLLSLGVPQERINSVQPEELEGTDCFVTTKKRGEYTNVTEVKVNSGDVSFV